MNICKSKRCPHCGNDIDELENGRLNIGYQNLKEIYPGGSIQLSDGNEDKFYVNLASVRLIFEFNINNNKWRIDEI